MLYENRHVAAAAGIGPATLRNWIVRGLVVPSFPAEGQGNPAKYTTGDLARVVALAALRDMGMGLADAADLAVAVGKNAAEYLLLTRPGVCARPSAEERTWRLYWAHTEHGWSWATTPDPVTPTITVDAAAMAEDAMQRLTDNFPHLEGHI